MAWNTPVRRGSGANLPRPASAASPQSGVAPRTSFERAVHAFVDLHISARSGRPYSQLSRQNVRDNLLSGRLTAWRGAHGIKSAEDWTDATAVAYLRWYQHEMGADSDTIKKVRSQLRQFAAFLADQLGNQAARGAELRELRVSSATDTRERTAPELTQAEATRLLAAAPSTRDRLIVAMLLYTGMRPSELLGLEVASIRLDRSPPVVEVRGSVHDPERTKTQAGARDIPLSIGQTFLPRLLHTYLADPKRPPQMSRLLLAHRRDGLGNPLALTLAGLRNMLDELGVATGIHCNAYRFRHTFCTWCADAGMHMLHLQQLLGHASSDMVAYYYRGKTSQAVLEAAARVRF